MWRWIISHYLSTQSNRAEPGLEAGASMPPTAYINPFRTPTPTLPETNRISECNFGLNKNQENYHVYQAIWNSQKITDLVSCSWTPPRSTCSYAGCTFQPISEPDSSPDRPQHKPYKTTKWKFFPTKLGYDDFRRRWGPNADIFIGNNSEKVTINPSNFEKILQALFDFEKIIFKEPQTFRPKRRPRPYF